MTIYNETKLLLTINYTIFYKDYFVYTYLIAPSVLLSREKISTFYQPARTCDVHHSTYSKHNLSMILDLFIHNMYVHGTTA